MWEVFWIGFCWIHYILRPTHTFHDASTSGNGVANKYFVGGPRLPNTSIAIIVPVLQQGHLGSMVLTGEPYTVRGAQLSFTDAKTKANIKKSAGFHRLRHSFATYC